MNTRLKACLVTAVALCGATAASAGLVGGSADPINTNTNVSYIANLTIVGAAGQTDTTVVTGTIDNNFDHGWKLTVASTNLGILKRTSGTGDTGAAGVGTEIPYTSIKLTTTGGTLGAGLTAPVGTHNIAAGTGYGGVAGTTYFNTGSDALTPAEATTATVGYGYALKISWTADTRILSGTYSDTITLTLANDT